MVGWSIFNEQFRFSISLLVAFYGLLRMGELLALQVWQIQISRPTEPIVISLGLTKTGKRQGAAESITMSELSCIQLLCKWKSVAPQYEFLTEKPHVWRDTFQRCLDGIGVSRWGFRPYSLRNGVQPHFLSK